MEKCPRSNGIFFQYANLADGVKPNPYEGNDYWKIEYLG
jgi:hypothetical protein